MALWGPHTVFIAGAYAIAFLVVMALVLHVVLAGRALRSAFYRLDVPPGGGPGYRLDVPPGGGPGYRLDVPPGGGPGYRLDGEGDAGPGTQAQTGKTPAEGAEKANGRKGTLARRTAPDL